MPEPSSSQDLQSHSHLQQGSHPVCILATLVVNSSPLPGAEPVFSTIFEQMFLGLIEGGFSGQESEASL